MPISILKSIALFALLGPIIGLITLAAPAMVLANDWSLRSLVLLIPIAYFAGGIPAAVCGLVVGIAKPRLRGVWGWLASGAVGAVCSISYYLLISIRSSSDLYPLALFFAPGFLAGLVCGIVFLTPPNNSFKPKPLRGSA